jgi:hypothetical protein
MDSRQTLGSSPLLWVRTGFVSFMCIDMHGISRSHVVRIRVRQFSVWYPAMGGAWMRIDVQTSSTAHNHARKSCHAVGVELDLFYSRHRQLDVWPLDGKDGGYHQGMEVKSNRVTTGKALRSSLHWNGYRFVFSWSSRRCLSCHVSTLLVRISSSGTKCFFLFTICASTTFQGSPIYFVTLFWTDKNTFAL